MICLKTHDFAASALPIGFNNYKYGLLLFSQLPNRLRGGAPPMSALVTLSCCFMGTAPLALLLGMIFEELMIGATPGGGGDMRLLATVIGQLEEQRSFFAARSLRGLWSGLWNNRSG